MDCASEDGRRPSVEERIQRNMEKSALRRKSLNHARVQKKRQSKIVKESPQDSEEEVSLCVFLRHRIVL